MVALYSCLYSVKHLSTMPQIDGFPFARYISESWFHHLHAAEEGGVAQTHILEWLFSVQPSALNLFICWEANMTSDRGFDGELRTKSMLTMLMQR